MATRRSRYFFRYCQEIRLGGSLEFPEEMMHRQHCQFGIECPCWYYSCLASEWSWSSLDQVLYMKMMEQRLVEMDANTIKGFCLTRNYHCRCRYQFYLWKRCTFDTRWISSRSQRIHQQQASKKQQQYQQRQKNHVTGCISDQSST